MPACEIEQLESRLELQELPDQLHIDRGPLGRDPLLVEVEVVLVEGRLAVEYGLHEPEVSGAGSHRASSGG